MGVWAGAAAIVAAEIEDKLYITKRKRHLELIIGRLGGKELLAKSD
jgi:hypothetical protein